MLISVVYSVDWVVASSIEAIVLNSRVAPCNAGAVPGGGSVVAFVVEKLVVGLVDVIVDDVVDVVGGGVDGVGIVGVGGSTC